jgi:hypothetical protein
MTLSHWRSTLLSANARRYKWCSSVCTAFAAACRALRPAYFSLEMTVHFCPGKLVANLSSLTLAKGFLWASAANAASWAGLDTLHNPVPRRLPTFPGVRYFCSHALAVDLGTSYRPPAALALNPPFSTRAMTRSRTDLSCWAIVIRMEKEGFQPHTSVFCRLTNDTKGCYNNPLLHTEGYNLLLHFQT